MTENFLNRRFAALEERIAKLTQGIGEWQQIAIAQEQRIERLELNFSALMATLNHQGRFEKFNNKYMAEELDRMVKAHHEQMEAVIAQAKQDAESSHTPESHG